MQLTAAAAGIGLGRRSAAANGGVRLICGFGAGYPTDLCAQLIEPGLVTALQEPVSLDYAIGEAGKLAALEVIESPPDGKTLLVSEILNLALHDARNDGRTGALLPRLKPIAKITRGFSTSLVTTETSSIVDWQSFVAIARSTRLTAATTGRQSTVGILLVMIEQRMKVLLDQHETRSTEAAVDLLRTYRADVAAIDTRLALLHNSRETRKLRIIATFGAKGSPELPQVPTFSELVGDPRAAYTISHAVFAPGQIKPDAEAKLTSALLSYRDDEDMHLHASLANIPLQIDGPSEVHQTIARDRRVIKDLIDDGTLAPGSRRP